MQQFKEMWKCPKCRKVSELNDSCYCKYFLDQFDDINELLVQVEVKGGNKVSSSTDPNAEIEPSHS